MTWLNWSLKLHSGLRTIPHLTLTHNTQVFDSMNAYLICVIVHVQMWCVCSNTWWSNPKGFFLCFICFWKWFYTFVLLVLVQNALLCFSSKNMFRGCFARSLRLRASREKCLREINFFDNSHINFCDCLATILQLTASRKMLFGQNWIFPNLDRSYRGCIATVSRLTASHESFCASEVSLAITSRLRRYCLTHKKRMFSVLYGRCDSFSNT